MTQFHLDQQWFHWFLKQDTDLHQNQALLHALETCPGCYENLGWVLDLYRRNQLPGLDFDVLDLFLGRTRAEAQALWEEIARLSMEERTDRALRDRRYYSWGLAELLCDQSLESIHREPQLSLHLAELAVEVAMRADGWKGTLRPEDHLELRQLAAAHRGNALRVLDDLKAADRAFRQPEPAPLSEGNPALGYRPRVLSLRASLRLDQRAFEEAVVDLTRGLELAEAHSDPDNELRAKIILQRGKLSILRGDLAEAGRHHLRAAEVAAELNNPRLEIRARAGLVNTALQVLDLESVELQLQLLRTLVEADGSAEDSARVLAFEGIYAARKGDLLRAAGLLAAARTRMMDQGRAYNAALVSLELALVFLERGELDEVQRLAEEMYTIFESREIHREAMAALVLFQKAAAAKEASREMVQEVLGFLTRAQGQPRLPFRPLKTS